MLSESEDRNDVGVPQPSGGVCFALEAFAHFVRLQKGNHLDGHAASGELLLSLEDDPHTAAANLADDAKVAEQLVR